VNSLIQRLAVALLVVSVAIVSATPAGAVERGDSIKTPLAGPWYTPKELKALIAFSNASLAERKAMLARSNAASIAPVRGTAVLAGPRYSPRELKALIAYSNASFAQKNAMLAGTERNSIGAGDNFHWSDAAIGAGAALGCLLVAGAAAALFGRSRRERRRLRHT
jgi:hypothetical protein